MKKAYIICVTIMMLLASGMAEAYCTNIKPTVTVRSNQGRIKYITNMARQNFIQKYNASLNTLGLTVAELKVNMTGEPRIRQNSRETCVGLKEVTFDIGYDEILVYIDKNYKPGTCQYRVVKDHENYHVAVHRQAMSFFKKDIEAAIRKSVAKLKPQQVTSSAQAQNVVNTQFQQIQRDIAPLLKHINMKIKEKNDAIDTPESYQKASSMCPDW